MAMVAQRSPVGTLTNTGYTAVVIVPSQTLAELGTPILQTGLQRMAVYLDQSPPPPLPPPSMMVVGYTSRGQ